MTVQFENIDLSATPDINANDLIMSKTIAEALHAHYPGHLWAITCEGRTGLITIRDLYLSGQYGYVLKIGDVFSISDLVKRSILAGGEILERFKLARGRFDEAAYHQLPTNFAGQLEFDRS